MKASASDEREHAIRLRDGRTLACLEIGAFDGTPVLYFHGLPGSRLEGRLATAVAGRRGLRVIASDRPGVGRSTFQNNRTIGAWPEDVAELLDQYGLDRVALVGVSGGGPYALACAARIPDRLTAVAVVATPVPLAPDPPPLGMTRLNRTALAVAARRPGLARVGLRVAAPWVRDHVAWYLDCMAAAAPPPDRAVLANAGYRQLIADSTAEALRQGGRGVARELTLLARPWDVALREVRMPVQIWHGRADTIVPPAMAKRLREALPASECRYVEAEGHLSLIVRHLGTVLTELCG